MRDEMLGSTRFGSGKRAACVRNHTSRARTVCFGVARAYVRPIVRVDGMGPCRAGPVHSISPILSVLDPVLRCSSRAIAVRKAVEPLQ
jgi:hypothetical protein